MGYDLQAIIGTQSVLETHAASFTSAVVSPLVSGFALIPITEQLLDEVGASGDSGQFYKFMPAIAEWLRAISASAPVAYVEAEYFGGIGGQSAVVWSHGEQLLAPNHTARAINIALRLLGFSLPHVEGNHHVTPDRSLVPSAASLGWLISGLRPGQVWRCARGGRSATWRSPLPVAGFVEVTSCCFLQ